MRQACTSRSGRLRAGGCGRHVIRPPCGWGGAGCAAPAALYRAVPFDTDTGGPLPHPHCSGSLFLALLPPLSVLKLCDLVWTNSPIWLFPPICIHASTAQTATALSTRLPFNCCAAAGLAPLKTAFRALPPRAEPSELPAQAGRSSDVGRRVHGQIACWVGVFEVPSTVGQQFLLRQALAAPLGGARLRRKALWRALLRSPLFRTLPFQAAGVHGALQCRALGSGQLV